MINNVYARRYQTSEKGKATLRAYYKNNLPRIKRVGKAYRKRIRLEVFEHYGGAKCICCGESNPEFLTLGHTNNDGAAHRRSLPSCSRGGYNFYRYLRREGYPPLPLQVECFNCNCGRFKNGGICPHLLGQATEKSGHSAA